MPKPPKKGPLPELPAVVDTGPPAPAPAPPCAGCARLRQDLRHQTVVAEEAEKAVKEMAEYIQFLEDHFGVDS